MYNLHVHSSRFHFYCCCNVFRMEKIPHFPQIEKQQEAKQAAQPTEFWVFREFSPKNNFHPFSLPLVGKKLKLRDQFSLPWNVHTRRKKNFQVNLMRLFLFSAPCRNCFIDWFTRHQTANTLFTTHIRLRPDHCRCLLLHDDDNTRWQGKLIVGNKFPKKKPENGQKSVHSNESNDLLRLLSKKRRERLFTAFLSWPLLDDKWELGWRRWGHACWTWSAPKAAEKKD